MDKGQERTFEEEGVDKKRTLSVRRYKYMRDWLTGNIGSLRVAVENEDAAEPRAATWFYNTYRFIREMLDVEDAQAQKIVELESQLADATEILERLDKKFKKHEPTLRELTAYFKRMQRRIPS
jgi:hypothetical protein